jgi:hypothetical protein
MARRKSRTSRSIRLKLELPVQVRQVPFEPFESIRHLDVDRLSRAARARFEVGQFEGGCCRRVVHAVVRKGMVTELEIEPCTKQTPMTPELRKTVKAATKALAKRRPGSKRLPMPVRAFLASPSALTIDTWGCFMICIFGWCLICCYDTRDPSQDSCSFFEDDWPLMSR